jgi:excisionase family DNA binding protein
MAEKREPNEMTTTEVARYLEVSAAFVRKLRIDGRLPAKRRVGPVWVFDFPTVKGFKRGWDRRPGSYDRSKVATA